MEHQVQVTFRGVPVSDAVLTLVRGEAARLRQIAPQARELELSLTPAPRRRPGVRVRASMLIGGRRLSARATTLGQGAEIMLAAVADACAHIEAQLHTRRLRRADARHGAPRRLARWGGGLALPAAAAS